MVSQATGIVVSVSLLLIVCTSVGCMSYCCTPDQFEAFVIYDDGNVFIDANVGTAYSYINSTSQVAYDYTRRATYLNLTATELSPLIPTPVVSHYTILNDYVKGVQYQFTADHCEKSTIGQLQKLCIPDNAIQLSHGTIGKSETPVVTFQYTYTGSPYTYMTTIQPIICLPVFHVFVSGDVVPDSGTMSSMFISDITIGIKDPSIFTPPSICLNGTDYNKKAKRTRTSQLFQKLTKFF